jgi:hypothetical protein
MNDSDRVRLSADIQIPNEYALQACAESLTSVLRGFKLQPDEDCRFDEYPAFIADDRGVEIVLFGIPDDEPSDWYALRLSTAAKLSLPEWHTALAGTFLQALLHHQPPPGAWRLDLSEDLARYLQDHGIPGCKAMPAA